MYYCMLATNWGDLELFKEARSSTTHQSDTAFWLKLVAEWIAMALYVFSLLGPLLCPNRDFS